MNKKILWILGILLLVLYINQSDIKKEEVAPTTHSVSDDYFPTIPNLASVPNEYPHLFSLLFPHAF